MSGKSKSKSSTDQSLDPWAQAQWEEADARFDSLLDGREFQPYTGDLSFTGFTGAGQSAHDTVTGGDFLSDPTAMVAGGGYDSLVGGQAMAGFDPSLYAGVASRTADAMDDFSAFDANIYVNPHSGAMIDRMTGDVEEATARARTASDAEALAGSAYGGSRHGVRDGLLDEAMLDTIADQSARISFETWDAGADRFYQDQANEFGLGQMELAALAAQQDDIFRSATFADDRERFRSGDTLQRGGLLAQFEQQEIDNLLSLDAIEGARADRNLALTYDDFLRQEEDEYRQILLALQDRNTTPLFFDSVSRNSSKETPGLAQFAGAGLTLADLYMTGGAGTAATGGLGAAL